MRLAPHPENELLPDDRRWWWACGQPERPSDEWACYVDVCVSCQLALEAVARREPDAYFDRRSPVTGEVLEAGLTARIVRERLERQAEA